MFISENIPALFKKGTLKLVAEDGELRRVAEATCIIEPFPVSLARELGEDIASHLLTDDDAIRDELESIDLRVRCGLQHVSARADRDLDIIARLTPVSIKDVNATVIEDKTTGRRRLTFSFVLVFSLEEKAARNFVLDQFGRTLLWSFESVQADLLSKARLHDAIADIVPEGTDVSFGVSGGELRPIDAKAHRSEAKKLRDAARSALDQAKTH